MLSTLGDWLAENYGKIDSATKLVVLGYCYGFRKGDPDAYRVVFKGTFDELYYGYGLGYLCKGHKVRIVHSVDLGGNSLETAAWIVRIGLESKGDERS